MAWYFVVIIGLIMYGIGYATGCWICKRKTRSELSGHLFITKSNSQPFLAASVPIETISEHKYVTFEVKLVDDSQK